MTDTSGDIIALSVQLTQTAMGPQGGWVQAEADVVKFLKTIHKTLTDLRYPQQQSR